MKASIVIPAFNEELFIASSIEAALKQDFNDFEVIVVNNASTDSTASIVQKHPTVRLITETRKGTQFAREAGRKSAQGQYIAFIDADCLPTSDWLSRSVHRLEKGYVGVSGPYWYYDAGMVFNVTGIILQAIFYWSFSYLFQFLRIGGVMIAGNSAITRRALEKINGFDTSITFYGDDTDTVKKLTKVGKVYFDLGLVMNTSGRRFKKMGIVKTFWLYVMNFFWITLFNKPFVRE